VSPGGLLETAFKLRLVADNFCPQCRKNYSFGIAVRKSDRIYQRTEFFSIHSVCRDTQWTVLILSFMTVVKAMRSLTLITDDNGLRQELTSPRQINITD